MRAQSKGYWGRMGSKNCDKNFHLNEWETIVISQKKVYYLTKVIDPEDGGFWKILYPEVTSDSLHEQMKNPLYGGKCFL
jgi:hypothetical protein